MRSPSSPLKRRGLLITGGSLVGGLLARPAIVRAQAKKLTIWHPFSLDTERAMREGVRTWNARHPNLPIEERIVAYGAYKADLVRAVAAGEMPDVVCIDGSDHAYFASESLVEDLTDKVKASPWVKADKYRAAAWAAITWNGRAYGVPRDSSTWAMFVNKDMLRQAGLNPDTALATWAGLTDAAKRTTSANGDITGFMFSARATEESTFCYLAFLWQAGGDLDRLDGPEAADALQFMVDFVKAGSASRDVLNSAPTEGPTRLIAGTVAVGLSGPWDVPRVSQQAKCDWAIQHLPVHGNGKDIRISVLGGWNWAIPSGTPNLESAWEFIEWNSQPDQLANLWPSGRLAPRSDFVAQNPALPQAYNAFFDELAFTRPRGPHPRWPDLSLAVQRAVQQAVSGQATVKVALQTAADTVRPIFSKIPLPK